MNFLKTNVEAIKDCDKELYVKILKWYKDKEKIIPVNKEKAEFYTNLIESKFKGIHRNKILFVYSADMESIYSLINCVVSNDDSKVELIIIMESNIEKIIRMLCGVDLADMIGFNMVKILCYDNPEEYYIRLNKYLMTMSKFRTAGLAFANYLDIDGFQENEDLYVNLLSHIKTLLFNSILAAGNNPNDSMQGLKHLLENIEYSVNYPSISSYKNVFKGRPAVLVAAGPSLNKDLEYISKLKGRIFICCVDTAYKTLLSYGVSPDMVVGIERTPTVINYYSSMEKYKGYDPEVLIAVSSLTDSNIVRYVKDRSRLLLSHKDCAIADYIGLGKDMLNYGKSVASCSVKSLDYMGFNKIYLVGQDLCYQDGKSHAEGDGCAWSAEGVLKQRIGYSRLIAKGNNGNVETTDTWLSFKAVYEKDIAEMKATVINCTVDGLKIGNIDVIPLDKVVFEGYDTQEIIEKHYRNTNKAGYEAKLVKINNAKDKLHEYVLDVYRASNNDMLVLEDKVDYFKEIRTKVMNNLYYKTVIMPVIISYEHSIDAMMQLLNDENKEELSHLYIDLFDVYAKAIYKIGGIYNECCRFN